MQNRGAPGSGPGPGDTRNMVLAIAISIAIMLGFEFFIGGPQRQRDAAARAQVEQQQTQQPAATTGGSEPGAATGALVTREEALASSSSGRVAIDTSSIDGSISLQGARIDDLNLRGYRHTIDPTSPEVTLLSPFNTQHGFDAFFGWEDQDAQFNGVGANDQWSVAEGAWLTRDTPLVLTRETGDGLIVTRTISVDENYMFTISDEVRNTGAAARQLRPFGVVRRQNLPEDYRKNQIVHQGMTGVFGPSHTLRETRFEAAAKHANKKLEGDLAADARIVAPEPGAGGWLGITDHYWMTAMVIDPSETISGYYNATRDGADTDYRAAYRGQWREIPAGGAITYTQRLFAGAKRVDLLREYQRDLNIPDFDKAVDWGMFFFLTRPFFAMLDFFGKAFGNFGLGILASTVIVKLALFPLIYQSYKAMAKLRGLQPKMKELQDRYASDKARQQQEMMRLYQTEKINPISGCLPILFQIPVFFALYKTLSVTIEMRHAPFFGWIHDLSAPDPTSIFNLFGLLPAIGANVHAIPVLGPLLPVIGVWPVLYGLSMWALQGLSPPPADPIQQRIFSFLPLLFTFMFAGFAAGMVIYWTWSNTLSILQQYVIMRRQGVETQLDMFLAKRFGKRAETPPPVT